MQAIASELSARLNTPVEVGGVEANMAVAGALTTPGCDAPLAILDLGAGSTDAAIINNDGVVKAVHLAGAGNMVSLLIQTELGLSDPFLAEEIPAGQSGEPVQHSPRERRGGVFFVNRLARQYLPKWCI
ncbi:Glycerol dehyrdratase activator [Salmonella sp. NCTC 11881]|nr:Glycerol dehyrdratase activator [Salmonella sp. NCTC 11881]